MPLSSSRPANPRVSLPQVNNPEIPHQCAPRITVPDWGPIQGTPADRERAEDAFDLTFGDIVLDRSEANWVFVGWARNSAGRSPVFVRQMDGRQLEPITYKAAYADTLEAKFPPLAKKRAERGQNHPA